MTEKVGILTSINEPPGLVAVTGASGFVGKELLAQLMSAGWQVRVLTREPQKWHKSMPVEIFPGDLVETRDWSDFLLGVGVVIHAAAEIRQPELMMSVNVHGPERLLHAAMVAGVRRWVQLSSVGAYGPVFNGYVDESTPEKPVGQYERTKTIFDQLLRNAGKQNHLEFCIVRPSNIYGPGMVNQSLFQMMDMIRRGWFAYIGTAGASANYVHVNDVASALLMCAVSPQAAGKTYNVSDWASMEDLVDAMSRGMGVSAPTRRLGLNFMLLLARSFQWMPWWPLTVARVRALSGRARYSTHLIEKDLGWRVSMPVVRGIQMLTDTYFSRKVPHSISIIKSKNIVFLTSHPMSIVAFMLPHIRALKEMANVQVLANTRDSDLLQQRGVDVPIEPVQLVRPIAPWADTKALWDLYWRFKHIRPSAVHTITPKAGLLGMAAAWLVRVPVRVHSFTGQVWVTRSGPMRWLLKAADKCIAAMATDSLVDSPSQRDFLIQEGVLTAANSVVLGKGSICGVNSERFCPNSNARRAVRMELGSSPDTLVCLYLGRLNRDKGVLDLAAAFAKVADKYPSAELWVVGPDEANWFDQMQALLGKAVTRVKRVGFTSQPERFMQASDLFCLPSYREGFGSSVIEAAACGVPALASRIYGLTDAVTEGETGWMHEPGNVQDLAEKLDFLLARPDELVFKGRAAHDYVTTVFAERKITEAMAHLYKKRLNETTL